MLAQLLHWQPIEQSALPGLLLAVTCVVFLLTKEKPGLFWDSVAGCKIEISSQDTAIATYKGPPAPLMLHFQACPSVCQGPNMR